MTLLALGQHPKYFGFPVLEQVVKVVLGKKWFQAWLKLAVDWFAMSYVAWRGRSPWNIRIENDLMYLLDLLSLIHEDLRISVLVLASIV